jgi:two-component system phosphate regulon response regulator PhoB
LRPDLILLDQMLPTMSGTEICKALRSDAATADIPIIMLTARASERDRVTGLEVGADDYVTKPFSIRELLLRVQGHLRRRSPAKIEGQRIEVTGLAVDVVNQMATVDGQEIRLTSTECKLLTCLARAAGQPVSRAQLLRDVWHYAEGSDTRTVDSHIKRLRNKLGEAGSRVETVQGVGYKLAAG